MSETRDLVYELDGLAIGMAANAEITKLKSQLEEARAAIRDYLDEIDAPVKDYALRTVLRNKLRALNESANKEGGKS